MIQMPRLAAPAPASAACKTDRPSPDAFANLLDDAGAPGRIALPDAPPAAVRARDQHPPDEEADDTDPAEVVAPEGLIFLPEDPAAPSNRPRVWTPDAPPVGRGSRQLGELGDRLDLLDRRLRP